MTRTLDQAQIHLAGSTYWLYAKPATAGYWCTHEKCPTCPKCRRPVTDDTWWVPSTPPPTWVQACSHTCAATLYKAAVSANTLIYNATEHHLAQERIARRQAALEAQEWQPPENGAAA